MVRNPRFGYGKNMNPCVDCRIMMLRQAKDYMDLAGADFVATGEVMGQRPFSQVKHRLQLTERESGLAGLLVRPLSAKLLPATIPEQKGWIDREQMMAIEGRSRKEQMRLARELGLEDYPNPASGCLLTDPAYSARLRDLLKHSEVVDLTDLNLLRTGRQFRLSGRCKAVVGRNEQDNARIVAASRAADVMLEVPGAGSPITILRGAPDAADIELAAAITARYSARRAEPQVTVAVRRGNGEERLTVEPATPETCERLRVAADSPSDSAGHAPE
jgi:tRNA U34 2-thiouridine synthase MnmA/TrmU